MRYVSFLIFIVFLIGGCAGHAVKNQDVLQDICRANHLFDIYQKEKIAFSFNVRLPDKTVKRSWEWHVKSNKIFLNGEAHPPSAMFINDIYWLLFPLKAYEDRDKTEVTVNRHRKSPRLPDGISRRSSSGMWTERGIRPTTPTGSMWTTR